MGNREIMANLITTHSRLVRRLGALAALLFLAPAADAVRVDPDGLGQVLIYPYYTVRNGNQTIYTVTNHTDRHKVLQVQMAEGRNGRTVLAFNVLLAPSPTAMTPRCCPAIRPARIRASRKPRCRMAASTRACFRTTTPERAAMRVRRATTACARATSRSSNSRRSCRKRRPRSR
jgi:hypothetical protein